jgi:hypothetical protein
MSGLRKLKRRTTVAEVLETAKTLPREGRAELTTELIRTLGTHDVDDTVRLEALREAVAAAEASIAAGNVIRIPTDGLREYIRGRGQRAAQIAEARLG